MLKTLKKTESEKAAKLGRTTFNFLVSEAPYIKWRRLDVDLNKMETSRDGCILWG